MKDITYGEILTKYEFGNLNGYSLFEDYSNWYEKSERTGILKMNLEKTLTDLTRNFDLRVFDFVLLNIQARSIDFIESDKHFDLIFKLAEVVTEEYYPSENGDNLSWILHQFADICFHRPIEIKSSVIRCNETVFRLLKKIGTINYESEIYGPEMYFATYKSFSLLRYLSESQSTELLENTFLTHFDSRIVSDAKKVLGMN